MKASSGQLISQAIHEERQRIMQILADTLTIEELAKVVAALQEWENK